MIEELANAKEEMKRVDHLFYVSLKYTRTVDVFKSMIERLINCYDFAIQSLLKYLKAKKKIAEIHPSPLLQAEQLQKAYSHEPFIVDCVNLYLLLRKLNKAKYTRAREFRRHVTMTAFVDDQVIEVTIDKLHEYYDQSKAFLAKIEEIVQP